MPKNTITVEKIGAAFQVHLLGTEQDVSAALAVAVLYIAQVSGLDSEELLSRLRELVAEQEAEDSEGDELAEPDWIGP